MDICSKKYHRIKISGQICFSVVILHLCINSTVVRHCSLIFSLELAIVAELKSDYWIVAEVDTLALMFLTVLLSSPHAAFA
jgi:hypothetical protein